MDRVAERVARMLGSAWLIGGFGLWTVAHAFITRDYVATISDLAIELGFLILRAENVSATRQEKDLKKDLRATRRIENKLD